MKHWLWLTGKLQRYSLDQPFIKHLLLIYYSIPNDLYFTAHDDDFMCTSHISHEHFSHFNEIKRTDMQTCTFSLRANPLAAALPAREVFLGFPWLRSPLL